ncbi:MAG: L-seryl-tRNA(Sec) selenium transferase, partial [Gammaproteobacteria bacterium]
GADLVTFSGDKRVGATHAGIIVGRKDLIAELKQNPMKRALRPDKLTLAFLEKTLDLYEDPERLPETLPLIRTMTAPQAELSARAERCRATLATALPEFEVAIEASHCQIGSGSLPDRRIDSIAVTISHPEDGRLRALLDRLRSLTVPVIGRLNQGRVWLDMRGAEPTDELVSVLGSLPGT